MPRNRFIRRLRSFSAALPAVLLPTALLMGAACNAYRLEPPAGFAEVSRGDYGAHLKANNDVGLRINVFSNVRGGTLAFWSRDLVEKLGRRGYTLVEQKPTESKNGVVGTRFDFRYTPVGKDEGPRFYTAVLFVTDEYRVVAQMAGREEYEAQYRAEIDTIVGQLLKVRGCKVITKACKGPQPEPLSTPATPDEDGDGEEADAEPDTEPSPKPAPADETAEASGGDGEAAPADGAAASG